MLDAVEQLEDRLAPAMVSWINPGSSNWDVGSNWSTGKVPGTGDQAVINTTAAITVTIQSGDNIQIQNVTTGSNDTLSITGGSFKVTSGSSTLSGPLAMTGGTLEASGLGVTLGASGSTSVSTASLYAESGATLSLPELTSYNSSNSTYLQASGSGSTLDLSSLASISDTNFYGSQANIQALAGGQTLLGALTTLGTSSTGAAVILESNGIDSLLDVAVLPAFYGYDSFYGYTAEIQVTNGGTIQDGDLTTFNGVSVTLDGTGTIATSQWTSLTYGSLSVTGGSPNFAGLSDIDASSVYVSGGVTVQLPALTSYNNSSNSTYLQASGSGSTLDLSALTTFSDTNFYGSQANIQALAGGQTLLGALTTLGTSSKGAAVILESDGIDSLLDIAALPAFYGYDSFYGYTAEVQVTHGGTLQDSDLTTFNGVSVTLDGTGTIATSQWSTFTTGTLTVTGGTYSLSGLTDADGSNLYVNSGGSLALPGLTKYTSTGNTFEANGTGSVLDVSAITTEVQNGTLNIYALNGGVVKVSSTLVVYSPSSAPDLQVTGLSVSPATGLQSGDSLVVNWQDANNGNQPTNVSWSDTVTVINTTTGATLYSGSVGYNASSLGNLQPGASVAQSVTLTLPDGANGAGTLKVSVTTNANQEQFEDNTHGTAYSNDTSSLNVSSTLATYANLTVTNLAVQPASPESGDQVTVSWSDANIGDAAVTTSFNDYIEVDQVNPDNSLTYLASGNLAGNSSLAAGASSPQSFIFALPNGDPGSGTFQITVTTDSGQTVKEYDSNGNLAYADNTATTTFQSALAAYPDLQVKNLAVAPTSPQSGNLLTITWDDANTGNGSVNQSFNDTITVINTSTGQTLLNNGMVTYNSSVSGSLAPGASAPESYVFQLPQGNPGTGNIQVLVTANADNSVFVYDPSVVPGGHQAAEANNSASTTVTSTLAAYPELATTNVVGPAMAVPGQPLTVTWNLANVGTASANGSWTEQVFLATDAAGDNPILLGAMQYAGSLGASQSVSRSATFAVPATLLGNYWLVVSENPFGELFEANTSNNTAVASQPTNVLAALTLALADQSVSDGAGSNATTATVTTNTSPSTPLVVTLATSGAASLTVPQTVTIPAGQTSVTFSVGTTNPGLAVGTQTATLTASATGLVSSSDTLTVTDVNVATLTVALASASIDENANNPATTGTVTRNTPTTNSLVVSLLSSAMNKLTVPTTVTIPAGQASATFPVSVVNDEQIDGSTTVTITASAAGLATGTTSAVVDDDNVPTLSLSLAQQTVSEAAGADATTGTVSIPVAPLNPITIRLTSSDTTAATVPASVVIDAGQTSATFPITAVDDGLDTGDKTATITTQIETNAGVVLTQGSASANLLLKEADGPALSIRFATSAVEKGAQTTATLSLNTLPTEEALVVSLSSSDTTKATVPASVTIPAGQTSVTFTVNAIDDHTPDGLQTVQIVGTASGFDTAITPLNITDVDLPDLVVSSVNAPTSGYDTGSATISWTVTNSGLYPAEGSWLDQIYLDPVGGSPSSTPADTVPFTGVVAAGQSYTQTDTIPMPATVGSYTVRIVTDASQSLQELSFSNNTDLSAQPLDDQASYTATVSTNVTSVSIGTAIPLYGVATLTSNDAPAANVPVAIHILVNGTERILTATTDGSGNYYTIFQPLPDETGQYSVFAADPGVGDPPPQVQFDIVGMTATPTSANVNVVPNTPLTGTFTLTNLSDLPLTDLTATSSGGPVGLTVQLTPPSQLAAYGTATLGYSLDATVAQPANGVVTIQVTSAEGAVLDIQVEVTVLPLNPVLATTPGFLNSGMLVGGQTLVSFTVVNNGGAPSGDLQVSLPATSYLSLASSPTIPSLAPGASATVMLQLTPPANLPLEQYVGTIGIGNDLTSISVPFTFTAITSAVGDVHVLVDDDLTFEDSGSPRVQGATVNLLNPYDTAQVIETGQTDATGAITFTNVPAGPYVLQVQAAGHSNYQNSYTVVAGITNTDEVFISKQFVTYSWVVQQTTIQDPYQIFLQTTFITNVPAPELVLTAPPTLPDLAPGQTGTFNVTVADVGLLAAFGVTLQLPTDPEYTLSALSDDIGVVPAQSSVVVPITVTRALTPGAGAEPCMLPIDATGYYLTESYSVPLSAMAVVHVPGRVCPPIPVLPSLPGGGSGGGGGGGVLPPIETAVSCNPVVNNLVQAVIQTATDVRGPSISTAAVVTGDDELTNTLGGTGSVSPLSFLATALGDLGLINGQAGNTGLSQAQAAQVQGTLAMYDQAEVDLAGIIATASLAGGTIDFAADLNLLQQADSRLGAVTSAANLLFGGDANWLNTTQSATVQQWLTAFYNDAESSSTGAITAADSTQLLATTLPSSVSIGEATEFMNRWNQTVQYWSEGIFTAAQVPAGQTTDFLDVASLQSAFNGALTAEEESQVDGYSDPLAELQANLIQVENDQAIKGVCVKVILQIDQTTVLTRSAYTGTLSLTNTEGTGAMTNVTMTVNITDTQGNPANGEFYVSSPTYSGSFAVTNGNATLPDNATGTLTFTFIPDDSAASNGPTQYRIGGTIGFTDTAGGAVSIPVFPATITVDPSPELQLNYFLQRDVIGNDPFSSVVVAPEPVVLGLLATNVGLGTANNLSITTAQPEIIENRQGLLDTFQIVGTQVGTQQVTPSLTVDLGDLASGQTADADFLLESNLQGIFTSFTASFNHSDALGGIDTSLISSVTTHMLIHAGDFNYPDNTGEIDYLAEDNANVNNLPDTIYFSDGTTAPVNIATDVQASAGATTNSYTVTANVTSGWDYIQLPDPGAGYILSSVVRSDGTVIPVSDMAWTTDRTFNAAGQAFDLNQLHILDLNSTGSYTVTYIVPPLKPLTLSPTTLPSGTAQTAYDQTLIATGGSGQITVTVSNIENPIQGWTFPTSGINGLIIQGTPTSTGTETFTVTATDAAGDTPAVEQYSITVNAASAPVPLSATQLILSPAAASVQAGAADQFTLVAEDINDNIVPGYTGTVTFSASDTTAQFADATTNQPLAGDSYTFTSADAGSHTFTVTDPQAGNLMLTAIDLTNNLVGTATISVVPGPPATIITKAGSDQTATVGTTFNTFLEAVVTDANGNPVSGVAVTFLAPSSGSTGTFAGASFVNVTTNANGVAVAPAFTAGTVAGSYSVTATVAGVATPASFSLTNTAVLSVASTSNATVLQNVASGLVKLATFNESGGSANAADYTATVSWGDGGSSTSSGANPAVTITISGTQVTVSGIHTYTAAGLAFPIVTLAYGVFSASTTANAITIDVAADVTGQTTSSASPYYRNPLTKLTTSTLTVINSSTTSLSGEFYLVLQGLTSGVTLQSASITVGGKTYTLKIDTTAAGDPMIVIPSSLLSTLASTKSFQVGLDFNNPSNKLIKYTTKLYSDPYDTL